MELSIIFLPLIASIISGFFGRYIGDRNSEIVTSALVSISALLSIHVLYQVIVNQYEENIVIATWISSGSLDVNWSMLIDPLSAVMLVVVTSVSALVHIYSIGYMSHDPHKPRFMAYLSLFTFAMLMLVTSDNFIQLFFGWEGVGLCSYFLIGFWFKKESANAAAIKAFVVNRVGDFGFALGIFLIFYLFGTVNYSEVFQQIPTVVDKNLSFLGFEVKAIDLICLLLFIGAMGKSAQILLHTWLPDAMEGPTPVSALIHAATMVTAGVFLTVRFSELMVMSDFIMTFVLIIGLLTAFFAASVGFFQKDIKKVIAYSTCSQLGFMFVACGLGAFNIAIFHLITHGYFKALLFLSSGSVIHGVHDEQDMDKMGNLFSKMKITAVMMWIGTLAIIGFPYSSGYFSKDLILSSSFNLISLGPLVYVILAIVSAMTAFYSFRLIFKVFHGNYNGSYDYEKIHESGPYMLVPLLLLSVGAILAGFFLNDLLAGYNSKNFWNGIIFLSQDKQYYSSFYPILSKSLVAFGVGLAVYYYGYNLNKLADLKKRFHSIYNFILNKWYFDELYNKIFVLPLYNLGKFLWTKIDQGIIDKYLPNGSASIVSTISKAFKRIQTGYIFDYTFIIISGFTLFITIIFYISIT